jgi:DNA-binding winged helix-turn-helix (wHTH) protein
VTAPIRFKFDEFVLSPRRRLLLRGGRPVPLIPKYLDLLILLVGRRREAVAKQAIFASIWSDVIVTDGALSQAVRTLRRALGDSPREPRFIRTVSRHGYQFVYGDVIEEIDDERLEAGKAPPQTLRPAEDASNGVEPLVERLFEALSDPSAPWDEMHETAERLHVLGTAEALDRIRRRPGHAAAVAVMRDARWAVPAAGEVPLDMASTLALVRLRLLDARRTMARRWASAAATGALGGIVAGIAGGLTLWLTPTSGASPESALALSALGALSGAVGAGGIGAGLAAAEVLARSRRGLALAVCGGLAGGLIAVIAHLVVRALLNGLLGVDGVTIPGLFEGVVIGGGAGLAYGVATRQPPGGGVAAPSGPRRLAVAAIVGLGTAGAGAALAALDRTLVGGLINEVARASPNAQLVLAPLGRLIGEPDFGRVTRILVGALEGGVFGFALAWGLTIRPKSAAAH